MAIHSFNHTLSKRRRKDAAPDHKPTQQEDDRMFLRRSQNYSNKVARQYGRPQPSLPKVTFTESSDGK